MKKKMIPWLVVTLLVTSIIVTNLIMLLISTIDLFTNNIVNSFPKLGLLPFMLFFVVTLIPLIMNIVFEMKLVFSTKKDIIIDSSFNKKMFYSNIGLLMFLLVTFVFLLVLFIFDLHLDYFSADGWLMIACSGCLIFFLLYPITFCFKFCPFKKNDGSVVIKE